MWLIKEWINIWQKKAVAQKIISFLDKEIENLHLHEEEKKILEHHYLQLKKNINRKKCWKESANDQASDNERSIYIISNYLDEILKYYCFIGNKKLLSTYFEIRLKLYDSK